jgi:Secretion system C-terminal sorting domain
MHIKSTPQLLSNFTKIKNLSVVQNFPISKSPVMKTFLQKLSIFAICFILLNAVANNTNAQTVNFSSSTTWVCPVGVTSIKVECWGGGGAGGGATTAYTYSGGGGGGAYAVNNAVSVTPGTTYFIIVGTGATGTSNSGNAGGASIFLDGITPLLTANGGAGGTKVDGVSSILPGLGNGGAGAIGTRNGGNGASGLNAGTLSGGGGGGAGTTANGGNAIGMTGGTGGALLGGAGGAGKNASANGSNGNTYGAGGGGGRNGNSTTARLGGNGANGFMIVTIPCVGPTLTNTATITVKGTYNWSALLWSLGHLPTACENAEVVLDIATGSNGTTDIQLNVPNISVKDLIFRNQSSSPAVNILGTLGSTILNVSGNIFISSPGANKFNRTVFANANVTDVSGNVILGTATPNATEGHASIGSGSSSGYIYNLYGDFTYNPRGYTTDERAVFNFNKAGTQYIYNYTRATDTLEAVLFETLNIGTTNATTVIFGGTSFDAYIEAERAAGVTIGVNSTLDLPGNYSLNKLTKYSNFSEPFNMLAGSKLRLGGDKSVNIYGVITGVAGSNFPASFTYNFNTTSTVEYYGNNAITQTIYNVPVYANLIALNGSGVGVGRALKITTAPLTTNTSFTINGSTDVRLGVLGSSNCAVNTAGPIAVAGGASTALAAGLYCNANVISGGGTYSMGNFSTLGSGHAQGIATSGATGNLQMTGARSLNSAGNYVYNGLVNQINGAGIPAAINDLTIDNPGTVTTTANRLVRGVTLLKQGIFDITATKHTSENAGTMVTIGGRMKADAGTVEMKGNTGIAQNLSGNMFVAKIVNTLINANTTGINVSASPSDTLLISNAMLYSTTTTNSQINTGNNVTLLSRATQTARFGEIVSGSGNTINGTVTVERFIPATRKWRLLAYPTNSIQTANQSWMENAITANANPKPGYGAIVTDEQAGWSANGFDSRSVSGPSVKYFDAATGAFVGIPNTTSYMMNTNSAYYSYIRGDRSSTPSLNTGTSTVLRATGTLNTGDVFYPVLNGKFVAIGNPYASAIDVRKINNFNTTNEFYVWDPKLSGAYGLGAYQLLYKSGAEYRVTPGGGSYPSAGSIVDTIESGLAMLVRSNGAGDGSLVFSEDAKTIGARTFSRGAGTAQAEVVFALLNIVDPGVNTLVDGAMAAFDNSYSSNVDFDDALKLTNTSENVSFKRTNTLLAIERRSDVMVDDTLHLNMTGLRIKKYQWDVNIANMTNPGRTAILVDRFTNTTTNLSLEGVTNVQFDVTSTVASYAANRFMIVFKQIPMPTTQFTTISAVRNANKTIKVNYAVANETNIASYTIEQSNNGTTFAAIGTQAPVANNSGNPAYTFTDNNASLNNNWYRVKFTSTAGVVSYSAIAMVSATPVDVIIAGETKMSVYPNPVIGGNVNLHLDNQAKGTYTATVTNKMGQTIKTANIQVNTNTVLQTIKIGNASTGSYQVTIVDEAGVKTTIPFIVK